MTTFIHSFSSRHVLCVDHGEYQTVADLKQAIFQQEGEPYDASFFICNGKLVDDGEPVRPHVVYQKYLRLPGGKGGFGSMLRAIGAQIEKTTNHEACRDLSGRRMRDINNEKDLKDWLAKQAEREREKEQRRQERIARRRAMPNHKFDDPTYDQQKSLLLENQEDALNKGLQMAKGKTTASATVTSGETAGCKRKCETSTSTAVKKKKGTEWLGIDMENVSDLDSDEENADITAGAHAFPSPLTGSDSSRSSGDSDRIHSIKSDIYPGTSRSDIEPGTSQEEIIPTATQTSSAGAGDGSKPDTETEACNTKVASPLTDASQTTDEQEEGSKSSNTGVETSKSENSGQTTRSNSVQEDKPLDLDEVTSVKELEVLGLEKLKSELMSRGLKCGGTLEQRAQRLFSVRGLTPDQIDPALFAKSNGKNVKNKK